MRTPYARLHNLRFVFDGVVRGHSSWGVCFGLGPLGFSHDFCHLLLRYVYIYCAHIFRFIIEFMIHGFAWQNSFKIVSCVVGFH